MIAEHVGTRTKEEVEEHYNSIYVDSPDWPLPVSCWLQVEAAFPELPQRSVWTLTLISIQKNSISGNEDGCRL